MQRKLLFLTLVLLPTIVLSGCSIGTVDGHTAEEWRDMYNDEESRANSLSDSLETANEHITEANDMISTAKYSVGGDYEEISDALDSLEEVDTVDQ